MLIPGELITIATFPGIIFHELGHEWFCKWTGVPVYEVCYFRLGNPAGYVTHGPPKKFSQSLLISTGPLLTGTFISLFVFLMAELGAFVHPWVGYFFAWLGVSIAANAFPSSGDAQSLWEETNRHLKDNFWAIIGYPFVLLIYIANLLSFFWFDFIYAGMLWSAVKIALYGFHDALQMIHNMMVR